MIELEGKKDMGNAEEKNSAKNREQSKVIGELNGAEDQRLKMEYDIAKSSTTSGVNARLVFLGFLITVNVAFCSGFYSLFNIKKFDWAVVFSLVVLALDVFVALLYVREHRMQDENHEQVWRIRERYNELMGLKKDAHPDWFIFKRQGKDFFSGLTYKMTTCVLSLFISLVSAMLFLILFSNSVFFFLVFFILFILVEIILIVLPDYGKKVAD